MRQLLVLLVLALPALADEQAVTVKSFDGFGLEARIATPAAGPKKVIVILHGSGPSNMDGDITSATRNRQKNLFYKDLSDALVKEGFGVLRYNKRSYQIGLSIRADPEFRGKPVFKGYLANPLKYFVDDAAAMAAFARKRFPASKVYLLGHSQGSYIALQLAHSTTFIKGVALIGFALSGIDTLIFEQTAYRPMSLFRGLDKDRNGLIEAQELEGGGTLGRQLKAQLGVIDLDADGKISETELKAGNLSNLILRDAVGQAYRIQEAKYPRVAEILKATRLKVAFFQGNWDNQTPPYNARSVQLINKLIWKKPTLRFWFFPRRGHALDPREGYADLQYQPADPKILQTLASELKAFF